MNQAALDDEPPSPDDDDGETFQIPDKQIKAMQTMFGIMGVKDRAKKLE